MLSNLLKFSFTSKSLSLYKLNIPKSKFSSYAAAKQWGSLKHGSIYYSPALTSFPKGLHTSNRELQANTKLDVVSNIKQLRLSPKVALALGGTGLIPFAAAPYFMASAGTFLPLLADFQNFYAATILSFLGGVRWGLTIPHNSDQRASLSNLGYSVMPQLWAFSFLCLSHYLDCYVVANVGMAVGLTATGYIDMKMVGYPGWFKGLRFLLTAGAASSLVASLFFYFFSSESKISSDENNN